MFAAYRKNKKSALGGTKGRKKALTPHKAQILIKESVALETPKKAISTRLNIPEKDAVQETTIMETKGLIAGRIIKTPVAIKQY